MKMKKEVDIILMFIFLICFFCVGTYIGVKDQRGEKIFDIDTNALWSMVKGAKELPREEKTQENYKEAQIQFSKPKFKIIELKDMKFYPAELEISVGTTVYWVNKDPKKNYRIYERSNDQLFNNPIGPFDSFNYTFNEEGTYYFNDVVFKFMKGVIIVT